MIPARIEFWPAHSSVASAADIARKVVDRWRAPRPASATISTMRSPWQMMRELTSKADTYRAELARLGGPVWPLPARRPSSYAGASDDAAATSELAERVERMLAAQECDDIADALANELRRIGLLFESDLLAVA